MCRVKRAGNTYCSLEHAHAAMRKQPVPGHVDGARQRRAAAEATALARARAALETLAVGGQVSVDQALEIVRQEREQARASGYAAGHEVARTRAHALRLERSKTALAEFTGSMFGKSFIKGTVLPDALGNFTFGLKARR
jgi:hypothetical protein